MLAVDAAGLEILRVLPLEILMLLDDPDSTCCMKLLGRTMICPWNCPDLDCRGAGFSTIFLALVAIFVVYLELSVLYQFEYDPGPLYLNLWT